MKKLVLTKETIRNLSKPETEEVAGDATQQVCPTVHVGCTSGPDCHFSEPC